MNQHTRRTRPLIALLAAAAACIGLVSAPASASTVPGGTVKGLVSIDGVPLAGARVTLVRRDGDSGDVYSAYKTVTTNSAGRYSLTRPRGSDATFFYDTVLVVDPQGRAVTDYRKFVGNRSTTVNRNVTLRPAASIAGKVTRADGTSPTSVRAEIVNDDLADTMLIEGLPDRYRTTSVVGADGSYRFTGLPTGTYTICYHDATSTYLDECFDEVVREGTTAPTGVRATGGTTKTLQDQVLDHLPAHVKGLVTDTSGTPIKGASVKAYEVGRSDPYTSTQTPATGRYDLVSGAAGAVQLEIQGANYESRWYDSATRADAQVFSLVEGATVQNQTVALRSAARLTVTARPGTGRATFSIEVIREATGRHPGGRVTVSRKDVSRTVDLAGGKATVTLMGVPAGARTFSVDYDGTASTAGAHRTVVVRIG